MKDSIRQPEADPLCAPPDVPVCSAWRALRLRLSLVRDLHQLAAAMQGPALAAALLRMGFLITVNMSDVLAYVAVRHDMRQCVKSLVMGMTSIVQLVLMCALHMWSSLEVLLHTVNVFLSKTILGITKEMAQA